MILELQQLHVVVVFAGQHGRARIKSHQTAFGQTAIFGAVLADAAQQKTCRTLAKDIAVGRTALQSRALA